MNTARPALARLLCLTLLVACGGRDEKNAEESTLSPCSQYCSDVAAACPTDTPLQEYPAHAGFQCLAYCETIAAFPWGVVGTASGNTVECRRTHARLALGGDAAKHCAAAGPGGDDICGTWCENYCALAMKNCTGANALFPDASACFGACAAYPTDGPWDRMSNSVQCRIMEAGQSFLDPAVHCAHAAPSSNVCL